jgi:putative solute:sodium symporter small subunit
MNHTDLIDALLVGHGAVAAVGIGMFYTYSDRTDNFITSCKGIAAVLEGMRTRIARRLADELSPVFQNVDPVPSPVLDAHGDAYKGQPFNPVGSEAYLDAIRLFVGRDCEVLADYRSLGDAYEAWCFWAKTLSWLVIALSVWQIIVLGAVFLDKVSVWTVPDGLNCAFWVPTVLAGIGCIVAVVFRVLYFNKMTRLRVKYGEL